MGRADVEVKILTKGVGEVFNSDGVVGRLEHIGRRIATEANDLLQETYPNNGFNMYRHYGSWNYTTTHGNRAVVVGAKTDLARYGQARHSVLTKAMSAGRC